jgi:hypothetical protein
MIPRILSLDMAGNSSWRVGLVSTHWTSPPEHDPHMTRHDILGPFNKWVTNGFICMTYLDKKKKVQKTLLYDPNDNELY